MARTTAKDRRETVAEVAVNVSKRTPARLRRQPRQARSQERIERILDTAESVFAEIGYDAATTNLIAQRANTSIGSLYEFFPNKEAIANSLAERYVEQAETLLTALFARALSEPALSPGVLVEQIVNGLEHFYREHPGAVPLLNGRYTSVQLAAAGESIRRALEGRVEAVFAFRRPEVPAAQRHVISLIISEMATAVLVRSDREPLSQRKAIATEIQRAVLGYLRLTEELLASSRG